MPSKARASRPTSKTTPAKAKPKPKATPRTTKARKLADAGFIHVAGWLPAKEAAAVTRLIKAALPATEAAPAASARRGRPPRTAAKPLPLPTSRRGTLPERLSRIE